MKIPFVIGLVVLAFEIVLKETRSDVGICMDLTFPTTTPLSTSFEGPTPPNPFSPLFILASQVEH